LIQDVIIAILDIDVIMMLVILVNEYSLDFGLRIEFLKTGVWFGYGDILLSFVSKSFH